jgi:hypothetical protein
MKKPGKYYMWSRAVVLWYYVELRRRGISYIEERERRLTGLVTSYVETAFRNTLLKER